jgi:hypothetical protein|tara:strand:- start:1152 stop:1346 length:195 start_codon:yes stop_codon:yes gene_type:complete
MKEITILEEARLSRLSSDELMVEAIEKASEHILRQTLVIKDLTARMSSLEDIVSELDNGIEDYR